MPTIKDLNDATQMQIELMKWETQYASYVLGDHHNATDEELDAIKDLLERNPAYIANAYAYFGSEIRNATSKKQIIMAWVCGECDDREQAQKIYDEAMSSKLSIAKVRKTIRERNGKPAAKKAATKETDGLFEAAVNWLDKRNRKNAADIGEDESEYLLSCDMLTMAEENLANVTSSALSRRGNGEAKA